MKDCWNQIGVWSKRPEKCEKLRHVIHCRNCEVYAKAGRKVFEKTIPADYFSHWTAIHSRATPVTVKKQCSVVIFRFGERWFCLPTEYCESVENPSTVHSIPRYSNELFRGIVNIQGNFRLCFSPEVLLQVAPQNIHSAGKIGVYNRLLLLKYKQRYYVVPVDEVGSVDRIDDTNMEPPAATFSQHQGKFVKGMVKTEKLTAAFLDAPPLFLALEEAIGG